MALCPTSTDKGRQQEIKRMKAEKELADEYKPKDNGKVQKAEPGPDVDGRSTEKVG